MSLKENISFSLQRYKEANGLSLSGLAEEINIAPSSLQCYLKGTANPTIGTIELIAEKMGVSAIEMVSGTAPEWERAETVVRAAKEVANLSAESQEQGIQLILRLVALFAGDT